MINCRYREKSEVVINKITQVRKRLAHSKQAGRFRPQVATAGITINTKTMQTARNLSDPS